MIFKHGGSQKYTSIFSGFLRTFFFCSFSATAQTSLFRCVFKVFGSFFRLMKNYELMEVRLN